MEKTVNLFCNGNPHGYRFNLNHPVIRKEYTDYLRKIKHPLSFPLSRNERVEFETALAKRLGGIFYNDK